MGKISRICRKISGVVNVANARRTINYMKKNGACEGIYAVLERMEQKRRDSYEYEPLTEEQLKKERQEAEHLYEALPVTFSILVPAYETKESYLRELIESVRSQTWKWFELVIADASKTDRVEQVVRAYGDGRVRYVRLAENQGISGNSNEGLKAVSGEYTGLLDHDDVLAPNALFEMAKGIHGEQKRGKTPLFLYSDEDKMDGTGKRFYDPHFKLDFNYDMLLTNNYICHFLVIRTEDLKKTGFRAAYDGAQDFDLVLRLLGKNSVCPQNTKRDGAIESVVHIPRILYHWRCHEQSTAQNPRSKMYAYEAGRKAAADYCADIGLKVQMRHEKHLGFYRVEYKGSLFSQRKDIGAVGGRLIRSGRVAGGAYQTGCAVREESSRQASETGEAAVLYGGLPRHFSGYLHRAVLQQDVEALDIRFLRIRKEAAPLLQEAFLQECGKELSGQLLAFLQSEFDEAGTKGQAEFLRRLKEEGFREKELKAVSLLFGAKLREAGYRLLYDPRKEWSL